MRHFPFYDNMVLRAPAGSEGSGGSTETEEETVETTEEESEESEEEPEEDEQETEEEIEEELSAEELKESKALYSLLKDPKTQEQTLRVLAERAGILNKDTTQKETKKDVKSLISLVEDGLGDKYKFLAPELAKTLESVLERERELNNTKLSQLEGNQIQQQTDAAFEKLARDTKGLSRKYESDMLKLADKLHPAAGMTAYEYLEHLYTIASSRGKSNSIKKEMADKINRNSKDVSSRLQSASSANGKGQVREPKTIKEAVAMAASRLMKE